MDISIEKQAKKTAEQAVQQPAGVVRLGIIGCGYVTSMSHLPAAELAPHIRLTALADVRLDLAASLAEQYHVPVVTSDYHELIDKVDAVVIAVPHHLHAPLALEFLNRGIHVLVEKPMANSTEECRQMIQAAQAAGAKVAVGLMRRFYSSSRLVKQMIETQFLGRVRGFEAQEAVLFESFKASAFSVLPPSGGVLLDTGPHTLDLLLWWLGDFARVNYWDDARGGVEANCRLEITTYNGIEGVVELSRTRRLENSIRILCELGRIHFSAHLPGALTIESDRYSGPVSLTSLANTNAENQLAPYFAAQLENFAGAILRDEPLYTPGEEGLRSVKVIEHCKRASQPLDLQPWEALNSNITCRI